MASDTKRSDTTDLAVAAYRIATSEAQKDHPDIGLVFNKLEEAVSLGSSDAMMALYHLYDSGQWVEKDAVRSLQHLKDAADANHPEAVRVLALEHYEGSKLVHRDLPRSFELYLRAALLGDECAVMDVAIFLYYGYGTRRDRRQAEVWINRAKELGVFRGLNDDIADEKNGKP